LAGNQGNAKVGGPAGNDFDAFRIGRLKAALLDLQSVKAWGKQGEDELTILVGRVGLAARRASDGHFGASNNRTRSVNHSARQIAADR